MLNFKQDTNELFDFIDKSPSAYHAVESIKNMLLDNGFTQLLESKSWELKLGEKYFVIRNGSSILAFTLPQDRLDGANIVASHSDSPCFKVKELSEMKVEGNYTKLNVENYGGMIMSTWMDRPLSLAGRVTVKTQNGIKTQLVNFDKDLLIIPNLAIHMQREINNGYKFNPQVDMLPLFGDETASLGELVAKELNTDKENISSADLFLYPRVKGTVIGANSEFIGSPRLDDLQCAFSSVKALINANENESKIQIAAVFDNEEVGSGTKQGAGSTLLFDVLTRVYTALGKTQEEYRADLSGSFMLSADNAHAVHPNFPEKTDSTNRNYLNKGIVIKFNANQKYTTDGVSAAIFKLICDKNEIPYQVFHNRSDMPGGSTLGNISNGHVSLNTVDIGVPQFAMHSAFETAGIKDTSYMIKAMDAFFAAKITCSCDDQYVVE